MKIAYLVNSYPAASHSFIRREIAAVEDAGGTVLRFSVRPTHLATLPDEKDRLEYEKTTVILGNNWFRLILSMLIKLATCPKQFWHALNIAFTNSSFRPKDIVRRIAYVAEAAWLSRRLEKERVDHVHAHFGTNSTMVARLAHKFGGPPYSFTVHGPDEFDRPIELDLRGKVRDSAFSVAISSFGKGQLMRWARVTDWKKIEIIRCGVDDSFIWERSSKRVMMKSNFIAVARLSGQKGIPLLVEAATTLKNEGYAFNIQVVGGGEMHDEIEKMIRCNDVSDRVNLVGLASSDEIIRRLLDSKAMVLPSFAEGLPVVIMEALALERPVIVTAIAGTPELVDNQCGWLIPSGSVEALVEALKSALVASPKTLADMGKAGRERVVSLHDSKKNGAELFRLFMNYNKFEG